LTTPYWNVSPETGRCDLWIEAAANDPVQLEAGIRALRDADAVAYFELKRKRGSRATTRVLLDETVAIETVLENGGTVIGPFTDIDGRERWHLGFATDDAIDTALNQLDRRHEFTIVDHTALNDRKTLNVFQHFDEATALLDGCAKLTEREEQILRTAVAHGYYETPRDETLASLGDRCGISDAAVSKTLRRAERKLLGAAVTALNSLDKPVDSPDDWVNG
jgi:predicted DNA binding protein